MTIKNEIKYFFKELDFIRTYNSPFKPLKLKVYYGEVALGTPYFFPRKWVKGTPKLIDKAVLEFIEREESFNKRNPKYARKIKSYEEIYESKKGSSYAVPKKIGFDFVGLGWKTKWTDTDYRFEWSPIWSFVFFKWQVAIQFIAPEIDHYWECWLFYTRHTDKTKSTKERLEQARKGFPCTWTNSRDGVKTETCYWDVILKDKWL